MSATKVTWGVGVELSEGHLGPLRFAACLAGPDDALIGVHVMPNTQRLHPLVRREQVSTLREQVAADVKLLLGRAGADGHVEVRIVENNSPEQALVEITEHDEFDALIIGRRALRDEEPLVRLGEICRRVLRRCMAPVIVVPPDFGVGKDAIDPGPVVLATNFDSHCAVAAAFAKRLADRLGRPLLVAHGIEAFNWGVSYLPSETFTALIEQAHLKARAELHEWVIAQGLEGAQEHVFEGDPARNLAQLSDERSAAALVTGSRKLGPIERVLLASVSSELAASARCPTAIVPG